MVEEKIINLYTGKIKFFNRRRGYGFIVSEGIKEDIFFHFSSMNNLHAELFLGTDTVLNFEISNGLKGIHAKNINYVETSNTQAVNYKKFVLFLGGIINEEIKKNKI